MRHVTSVSALALLTLGFGCSSEEKKPAKYLGLEVLDAKQGIHLRSQGVDVPPGQDVEYCETAQLPGSPSDTYYVNQIEYGNGDNSHHLIIGIAEQGSAAETEIASHEIGYTVPCRTVDEFGAGMEFTGGVQQPYGKQSFPPGVGRVYHGGQRLIFDYHYYNTTLETVHALSAVNFHLTDASNVKHIARIFGFSNWTINTPPHQKGSFTGECHFTQDATINGLTRHTHRWGTDYTVWYSGGPNDGQQVFKSLNYEDDVDHYFPAPRVIKAGEGFRFQCNYDNTEDHTLAFGLNATDEMCILFGEYWEAIDGQELNPQDCSITTIDAEGIGRPLSEGGEFRAPTSEEVAACISNSGFTGACADCSCNTCGGVAADCYGNVDCKAIMDCIMASGCTGQESCSSACADAISAHATAVGMLIQLSTCFSTCNSICGTGTGADGGVDGG